MYKKKVNAINRLTEIRRRMDELVRMVYDLQSDIDEMPVREPDVRLKGISPFEYPQFQDPVPEPAANPFAVPPYPPEPAPMAVPMQAVSAPGIWRGMDEAPIPVRGGGQLTRRTVERAAAWATAAGLRAESAAARMEQAIEDPPDDDIPF